MCTKILVWKREGERLLGRLGHRREDNIRMDLREIRWEVVDSFYVADDRDQWWAFVNIS
jgi:hypothetical protein